MTMLLHFRAILRAHSYISLMVVLLMRKKPYLHKSLNSTASTEHVPPLEQYVSLQMMSSVSKGGKGERLWLCMRNLTHPSFSY